MAKHWIAITKGVAVVRGPAVGGWAADHDDEAFNAKLEAEQHLGDYITPQPRMFQPTQAPHPTDTGRELAILIRQSGPQLHAVEVARTKAQYAAATWALLAPPIRWHLYPDVGVWCPQPYLQQGPLRKPFEQNAPLIGRASTSGRSSRKWASYDLPEGDVLRAPFDALEAIDSRAAQALLSSTAALISAMRATRSRLSERFADVQTAIECLCEPADPNKPWRPRWETIRQKLDGDQGLVDLRGYSLNQVEALHKRMAGPRNISTHGADAAVLDLGWGKGNRQLRGRPTALAEDLKIPALHRDLAAISHVLGDILIAVWEMALANSFDEAEFETLFRA